MKNKFLQNTISLGNCIKHKNSIGNWRRKFGEEFPQIKISKKLAYNRRKNSSIDFQEKNQKEELCTRRFL